LNADSEKLFCNKTNKVPLAPTEVYAR
jgi:hypothetical protein